MFHKSYKLSSSAAKRLFYIENLWYLTMILHLFPSLWCYSASFQSTLGEVQQHSNSIWPPGPPGSFLRQYLRCEVFQTGWQFAQSEASSCCLYWLPTLHILLTFLFGLPFVLVDLLLILLCRTGGILHTDLISTTPLSIFSLPILNVCARNCYFSSSWISLNLWL